MKLFEQNPDHFHQSKPLPRRGRSRIFAALEIGTSKIVMLVGEVRADGTIKILGRGQTMSKGVRKGEILDKHLVRTCLGEAIQTAELNCETTITAVLISVTGTHIAGVNARGQIRLPENARVSGEDIEEVREAARQAVNMPQSNVSLHTLARHYSLDGQEGVRDPIGREAMVFGSEFHIVHGSRNRFINSVKSVRDYNISIVDVIFAPVAAAQMVLTREEKNHGCLMIDMGAGTCDWILFHDGVVAGSGCLGVGGDHISSDLATVFKITQAKAEKLKVEYGHASIDAARPGELVMMEGLGEPIEQREVNEVIHCRVREMLEKVKAAAERTGALGRIQAGVRLTGGTSLLPGIEKLAQEIFKVSVQKFGSAPMLGVTAAFEDPRLSTVIGLIRNHHFQQTERAALGSMARLKSRVKGMFQGLVSMFSF